MFVLARDLSYILICKCDVKTLYIFVAFPESLYCAITRRFFILEYKCIDFPTYVLHTDFVSSIDPSGCIENSFYLFNKFKTYCDFFLNETTLLAPLVSDVNMLLLSFLYRRLGSWSVCYIELPAPSCLGLPCVTDEYDPSLLHQLLSTCTLCFLFSLSLHP